MSILVVCPNGHKLKVKDKLAGKQGFCPKCKAPVTIPELSPDELSEDAILDILGPRTNTGPGASSIHDAQTRPRESGSALSSISGKGEHGSPPKKSCHKCHQEIEAGVRICPHCHTYIAGLADF